MSSLTITYTIINNSKAYTSINNSKACRILIKSLLSPYHLNSRDIQCSKVLSTDKISRHLHQHFHQSMTETDPNGIKLKCKYCPSGSLGEYSYKSSSHLKSHIIPQRCPGPGQVAWSEGDNSTLSQGQVQDHVSEAHCTAPLLRVRAVHSTTVEQI